MKNISLILASILSIAFTSPVIDKATSKPTVVKGDRLPKIGFIQQKQANIGGVGCYYYIKAILLTSIDKAREKSKIPDGAIDEKGMIEISNRKQSKSIKILGYCGD